jgi:2',3'-cyclic-nucleotide 2'-phosphodiesterase (5'-nucleotidase family)
MDSRAMIRRVLALTAFVCLTAAALADDPSLGSTAAGQAVADAVKEFTGSDIALIPAGVLKDPEKKEEVTAALSFGTDGVVVVNITGAKIREALERSVSAFPQSNVGFLQVSGLEAAFKKSAPANSRITSVTVGTSKLEDGKTYAVAMPVSLQQGQLGYANLWENSPIVKRFKDATLATIVKGRRVGLSSPRWSAQA